MTSLLEVHGLVKQFGGHRAVDEASFAVEAGSITRLIGPNGAGKTTAFNCIAGFLGSDGGRVLFDGQEITGKPPHRIFGLGLTRTFQIPQELSSLSVLENLLLVPEGQTGEPLLRPWRERREEAVNVTRAKEVLALVELTPLMRDRAGSLSGGQQKLLELAPGVAHPTGSRRAGGDVPADRARYGSGGRAVRSGDRDGERPSADAGIPQRSAGKHDGAKSVLGKSVPMSDLLHASGVSAGYGDVEIIHDVDLRIAAGEIVTIIGPNGAGKSTLLKALFGAIRSTQGEIWFRDADVTRVTARSDPDSWCHRRRGTARRCRSPAPRG
jgi:ABC-type branched-subunit amino acid transport system ATPase component